MLAISTAWNAKRHESGRAVIEELRALGFQHFEINVHFDETMVLEIEPMVRDGTIQISSLHNYCPVPPGIDRVSGSGDLFSVSSLDEEKRKCAVEWTKRTLEWAARLRAGAIVVHWGEVDVIPNRQKEYVQRLLQHDPNVREEIKHALEAREQVKRPYLENAKRSLQELADYARPLGIRLGVETRYYFHQIPSLDEIGELIAVAPDVAGYWHDTGHAQTQEWIGTAKHLDYLTRHADQMIGCHVMDITGGDQDHHAFGHGDLPIEQYAPYLTRASWQVMEIHHATGEELITSRNRLEACGFA